MVKNDFTSARQAASKPVDNVLTGEHVVSGNRGRPEFSTNQILRLTSLGLDHVQIAALEGQLRIARAMLVDTPTRTDVKAALNGVAVATDRAAKKLSHLVRAREFTAQDEALTRLTLSGGSMGLSDDHLHTTLIALSLIASQCQKAIDSLPKEQNRPRALWDPIMRLWTALSEVGYIDGRSRIKASSWPGSKFVQIMDVCYQAIDSNNTAPTRAVKSAVSEIKRASLGK